MSGFDGIIGQQGAIGLLTAFLRKGNLPHALLFVGRDGVGKRTTALRFAMACNCTGPGSHAGISRTAGEDDFPPCGSCPSCRKTASGNHPDIIRIEPSGTAIRIAQIRDLYQILALKPYEARVRVILISDAQAMNPEAGNALLKILEEPPSRTVLILTANEVSDLIPTIVSRCHPIRFLPLSRDNLEAWLTREKGMEAAHARVVAMLADGSIARAISFQDRSWVARRQWVIEELRSLASGSITASLGFAEKLARNKDLLPDLFYIMKSWTRDLAVFRHDPENVINRDFLDAIRKDAPAGSAPSDVAKMESLMKAERAIRSNCNLRLTLDLLALDLAGKGEQAQNSHSSTMSQ